jgi:hypothetical protein
MNDEVFPTPAVEVFTFAMYSVASASVWVISKRQERRYVAVGKQPYISTFATIATIRATHCFWAFTSETDTSGATIAAPHIQLGFIDKHAHKNLQATSARYSN